MSGPSKPKPNPFWVAAPFEVAGVSTASGLQDTIALALEKRRDKHSHINVQVEPVVHPSVEAKLNTPADEIFYAWRVTEVWKK